MLLGDQLSTYHATRAFDEPSLLDDRGPLPLDRPHYVKLDAAYQFPLSSRSALVLVGRFRALSGTPRSVLLDNGYDALLPRGAVGRTPVATGLDVRVAYRRQVSPRVSAEVFADVFNLLDRQDVAQVHENYANTSGFALEQVRGVEGGDY